MAAGTDYRYLNAGAGWAYMGMRDKGITPLYYSGGHALFESGYYNRKDSVLNRIDISFMTGNMSPVIYPELTLSVMKSLKGNISYSHLRFAGALNRHNGKLFLGGNWKTQYAYYRHNLFTNSSRTSYFLSQINIDGLLSFEFDRNDKMWLLEFGLAMPLVTFIVRPDYAYIFPAGFLDHNSNTLQSAIQSIEIAAPHKFFGLASAVALEYKLRSNHALRIKYTWEYFGHHSSNMLNSATHGIGLQTLFNF